eukprot:2618449-Rhodomonas_salina.1
MSFAATGEHLHSGCVQRQHGLQALKQPASSTPPSCPRSFPLSAPMLKAASSWQCQHHHPPPPYPDLACTSRYAKEDKLHQETAKQREEVAAAFSTLVVDVIGILDTKRIKVAATLNHMRKADRGLNFSGKGGF